jgi:NAD(P)-dependent dehydrogenase (short-subunit alcohol dehydrogenase family)
MTIPTSAPAKRFAGKAILVTGAAGHLGSALAEGIVRDNGVAVLNGRTRETLVALAERLDPDGGRTRILCADVADAERMQEGITAVCTELEAEDVAFYGVVNNAFAGTSQDVFEKPAERYAHAARINLGAVAALIDICAPILARSAGSVVNVSSMYGHVSPDPRLYPAGVAMNPPHYGATKAGLLQLTRYYAVALAAIGVRVNSVSPGPFPRSETLHAHPEFAERLVGRVPLRRLGRPAELYGAVAFLLGAEASYITGTDIAVDGGWTAI